MHIGYPLCINKYDVKSHLCVKHLSQTVHLHGRSPLCTSKCFAIWAFRILYIICQTQDIGMEVLHCVEANVSLNHFYL